MALNILAINLVLDYLEVEAEHRLELISKVETISRSSIDEQRKEQERLRKAEEAKRK